MGSAHFARSVVSICNSGQLQDSFARSLLRRDAFRWPGGGRAQIFKVFWATVTDFSLYRCAQVLDLYSDFCLVRSFPGERPSSGVSDFLRHIDAWLLTCAKNLNSAMGGCLYRSLRGSSWICPPNEGGFGTDCSNALFKSALSRPFVQMASRSAEDLLVGFRRMDLRFFRQVQLYLVCCCAGLFHGGDLWNRDISEGKKRASESIGGDCQRTRRGRNARVMDCLPPASEAAHPGVLRPVFADVVALRIHVYRRGHRLPVVYVGSGGPIFD